MLFGKMFTKIPNSQYFLLNWTGGYWYNPEQRNSWRGWISYRLPAVLPCPCCGVAKLQLQVNYWKCASPWRNYYEAYVFCNLFGCGTRGGKTKQGLYTFYAEVSQAAPIIEVDYEAADTAAREAIKRWNRRGK